MQWIKNAFNFLAIAVLYLVKPVHYLANLGWTVKHQPNCRFCKEEAFSKEGSIVYEVNEYPEPSCLCEKQAFANPTPQDDHVRAVNNLNNSSTHHWFIMPKEHLRDIENLTSEHIPLRKTCASKIYSSLFSATNPTCRVLVEAMDRVKEHLLETIASLELRLSVHSGYHRGRRHLFRDIYLPDIISIHHLHLHVVVKSRLLPKILKYWNPLLWKSDAAVMNDLKKR
ncbi:Histidine triad-like motif-containing protein [Cordyceps fumosorosea ARSEF 2679]|uniref:Histidine triad-like motif-containing protein n=1 Tax=Cordyceps fumosorosea (strain ARSEF 2679) TaxID=1081104 RepID=A0A167TPV3_CORFA|nr:Histidine triad-like motif-containing protein [Cordyceps fumosorosea ARSEF 2679]OAA60823.1 Histidine triad-like motif-containing protein [Cordyceps fumosorosea ARSEF 2679]